MISGHPGMALAVKETSWRRQGVALVSEEPEINNSSSSIDQSHMPGAALGISHI